MKTIQLLTSFSAPYPSGWGVYPLPDGETQHTFHVELKAGITFIQGWWEPTEKLMDNLQYFNIVNISPSKIIGCVDMSIVAAPDMPANAEVEIIVTGLY